jgi:phosphatidylglycerophosphate synthase
MAAGATEAVHPDAMARLSPVYDPKHRTIRSSAAAEARLTLPNLLSASRLLVAPALLYCAWAGEAGVVLVLLGASILSDIADGQLARRLDQVSQLGGELDSWGDLATYLAAPICAWWIWPEAILREPACVIVVVVSYTATTAIGFVRYHRLKSFHTWSGRVSAVLLAGGSILLLLDLPVWPMRIAAAVVVISDLEEIAMMALLPQWETNVPSLWHALERRPTPAGSRGRGSPKAASGRRAAG